MNPQTEKELVLLGKEILAQLTRIADSLEPSNEFNQLATPLEEDELVDENSLVTEEEEGE